MFCSHSRCAVRKGLTFEYRTNVRIPNACPWPNAGWQTKLADSLRQLEGSKAIEDALQSELNTTLTAYAQSKEGNQKLIQVWYDYGTSTSVVYVFTEN